MQNNLIEGRITLSNVPLKNIIMRSIGQTRAEDFNPDKYPEDEKLLESIKKNGVVVPIMLHEFVDDTNDGIMARQYEIVYGHRRVAAAKKAELITIPALIAPDNIDEALVTFVENQGIRKLTGFEQGLFIINYAKMKNIPLLEVSKRLGYSVGYVSELNAACEISQNNPILYELYSADQIKYRDVIRLDKIISKQPANIQNEMYEKIKKMSLSSIREFIQNAESGVDPVSYLNYKEKTTSL